MSKNMWGQIGQAGTALEAGDISALAQQG